MPANILSLTTLLRQVVTSTGLYVTESTSGTSALQAAHQFVMGLRPQASLTFPVPYMMSTIGLPNSGTLGTPLAFDLFPTGSGTHSGHSSGNGYTWIDVCDLASGLDATDSFAATTIRIGNDGAPNYAYIASLCYGTAGPTGSSKPFQIHVTTTNAGGHTAAMNMLQAIGGVAAADSPTWTIDPVVVLGAHGGSVVAGSGYQLATNTTVGFLYVPQMAGAPTGTPPIAGGGKFGTGWSASQAYSNVGAGHVVPIVVDITNSKLWAYIGGAWKGVVLA